MPDEEQDFLGRVRAEDVRFDWHGMDDVGEGCVAVNDLQLDDATAPSSEAPSVNASALCPECVNAGEVLGEHQIQPGALARGQRLRECHGKQRTSRKTGQTDAMWPPPRATRSREPSFGFVGVASLGSAMLVAMTRERQTVRIDELRAALDRLLRSVEETQGTEVELGADQYWLVSSGQSFDLSAQPQVGVGQLSDDLESLTAQLTEASVEPVVWHELEHLIGLLRRLAALDLPRS